MNTLNTESNNQSNKQQSNKQPNKFLAPIVIAGVTIGFLASAYKFIFAKTDPTRNETRSVPEKPIEAPQQNEQDVEPKP